MPRFQRRVQRRFRRRRRIAWYNKKYSTAQIARAAWRSAKYIRGLVNSEMFHLDNAITLGNAQNAIELIPKVAIGDTVASRTGNSILAKAFSANGYMYINSSQTTNTRVMLAIIMDKQQVSDTIPSLSDIFVDPLNPSSLLNRDNLGRFTVMWRKQYTLSSNTAGNNSKQVKIYKRFQHHVRYNGSAITDIQRGGMYFCIITSEPSMYPTVTFQSRFSYHDN